MKRKSFRGRDRRFLAGWMAVLCLFLAAVPFRGVKLVSRASTFRGTNIWSGGSEMLFGKNRNYLYRWTDGFQAIFCISPGKHMGSTVVSEPLPTTVTDENIPYIQSREDYGKLAALCTWFDQNGSIYADNATYAAVQAAVWAIMNGGWETADDLIAQVDRHVQGTAARWKDVKAVIEGGVEDIRGLPDWIRSSAYEAQKHPVQMRLENGVWTAELDISAAPQAAAFDWKFEGEASGWSGQVSGGKLIITYTGSSQDGILISAELPEAFRAGVKNTTTLNIYVPVNSTDRNQAMISARHIEGKGYVQFTMSGEVCSESGRMELALYEHRETFRSHYSVELDKFCAETGKKLENAGFRVLEAFEENQLEGNISTGYMEPKPPVWRDFKVCAEVSTDENGHAVHTDVREYQYRKTYCDGHPEPDYLEAEGDSEEENAAVEEENARLRARWEALAAACEARERTGGHFHGMAPGEALDKMLADREEAYDRFIHLKYDYTFQEIRARYGYTRHGQHRDDIPIPVVRIASSEAGGGGEEILKTVIVNESAGTEGSRLEDDGRQGTESGSLTETVCPDCSGQPGSGEDTRGIRIFGEKSPRAAVPEAERRATVSEAMRKATGSEAERRATVSEAERNAAVPEAERRATVSEAERKATGSEAERREETDYRYVMPDRTAGAAGDGRNGDDESDSEGEEGAGVLPEPMEDSLPPVTPSGDENTVSHVFRVEDHRAEGEIHINKRDSELLAGESDSYDSYGDTQGDATLEGAVYGLYAAEEIVHPDGKTGTVYEKGALTAIGTTDKNGDASFLVYTEESPVLDLVGHPLILGRYQVREIARSEGYELTDPGTEDLTEPDGSPKTTGRADVVTAMTHPIDMHDGSWLEFDVTYQDTAEGFDILVSGFPEGSTFFRSKMKENRDKVPGGVIVGTRLVETGEYEKAEEGEYRLDENGNCIPVTDEQGNPLYDRNRPAVRTYYLSRRLNCYPNGSAVPTVNPGKWRDEVIVDTDYIRAETNSMLEQTGYRILDPGDGDGAPWTVLKLEGTTNRQIAEEILDWFADHSFWDSGAVHSIRPENGAYEAVVFHDYLRLPADAVYEERSKTLFVKVPVETEETEGTVPRHMFVEYAPAEFTVAGSYITVEGTRQPKGPAVFPQDLEELLEPVYEPLYERYAGGENRLDGQGNPIPVYRKEYIYEEKEEITSEYDLEPMDAVYDARTEVYRIHVENTVDWSRAGDAVTETFRAVAPQNHTEEGGREEFYSDYLTNGKGAGASAFASSGTPSLARLTYPGQISPMQDGEGTPGQGTRTNPFPAEETVIRQSVKVIKDVRGGTEEKLGNFRFKVYLKSNLERLYRNAAGEVVWLDRKGRTVGKGRAVGIIPSGGAYPGLVPDIFTRVPRRTEVLYKNTAEAVIANRSLYDEEKGTLSAEEYTAVLETVEKNDADADGKEPSFEPNYEKFFQAIRVANHDLWDDNAPGYTSYRPLGSGPNRGTAAEENAKVSDMVRQFAIDWYLDGEAEKLIEKEEGSAYGDQLYDEALRQAIGKAENYLEPFFRYDLDEIYAVAWDPEERGGTDGDPSTLSADREGDGGFSGASESLPYGTYVVVEQQPAHARPGDFPNRHYAIDLPKEITVPSVYEGSEAEGEVLSSRYRYRKEMGPEEMTGLYRIRFCGETDMLPAHNNSGDFEIYKYGMDIRHIQNGVPLPIGEGHYFALTQDRWKPYLNYYNVQDDRTAYEVNYYLAEGADGREPVGKVYRYSSVSEAAGEENGTAVMTGMTRAYDGAYCPAFVRADTENRGDGPPGTIREPARVRFRNRLYQAGLRIEKMDSETGENLLHDEALFNIYRAERDEAPDGEGRAKFYEEDTTVSGTREFLESMKASDIRPVKRGLLPGKEYTGVVAAGTPVCLEENRIYQTDALGRKTGTFASFTTARDGSMKDEATGSVLTDGEQNAGYLLTPEPLSAGVYVLAESAAPDGYVRCGPVAVEIYSDEVTYYRKGSPKDPVTAAVYGSGGEEGAADTARIYVENAPTGLRAEKLKEGAGTVTYQVSGRIDGSLAQIGGSPDYEYAYRDGQYMGYAWRKGTLEYLKDRKDAGEQVEIVYEGELFAGYGYVTAVSETADDENPYVTGAVMTLFEGIPVVPSGDSQDFAYEGLKVERSLNGTVERMYLEEGFAGSRTEFVQSRDGDEVFWSAETVPRADTDILYYDLGDLQLFQTDSVDGREVRYGFGRNHEKIPLDRLEEDKRLTDRTGGHTIFAFRGSRPVLELEGGDFTAVSYSPADKVFEGDFARPGRKADGTVVMGQGVTLYHLDRDGNRDSLVDPYTGMAYVLAEEWHGQDSDREASVKGAQAQGARVQEAPVQETQILVWPVKIARDEYGQITAKDKITTYRIATAGEDRPGQEYLTGSWQAPSGESSHLLSTFRKNSAGQNMNEEQLLAGNNGSFPKTMCPVYDEHGLPEYYQRSSGTYERETVLYDRSGSRIREKGADLLDAYDRAAYDIDFRAPNHHRLGETYILENTWVSGESSPNDPFAGEMTDGQPDILRRVPIGTYIMEELAAPDGYLKGFPTGVAVKEQTRIQKTGMADYTTKLVLRKVDGSRNLTYAVLDMGKRDLSGKPEKIGRITEGKGAYSFAQMKGAELELYEAERVYTTDLEQYPSGTCLRKKGDQPLVYLSTNSRESHQEQLTARWVTEDTPLYLEGIPAGEYLLEETARPDGFVSAPPAEVTVDQTRQVQIYEMYNDHTKIEIEKYTEDAGGGGQALVPGAEFVLYEALTDEKGRVQYDEQGYPRYDGTREVERFLSGDGKEYAGFADSFEDMYRTYGTEGRMVSWVHDGRIRRAEYVSHTQIDASEAGGNSSRFPTVAQIIFRTEDNAEIRVTVYEEKESRKGKDFVYEYQFDYRRLPRVNERAASYLTADGRRRLDYLPVGTLYVLAETRPPAGFSGAAPVLICPEDTADVQRYRVYNREGTVMISKVFTFGEDGEEKEEKELPGASLALYRAGEDGALVQDAGHLAARWISGSDGAYTELDRLNGRIPEGYREGDLKPHVLRGLPDGDYWLTELESPDYYTTFRPVRISCRGEDSMKVVRVSDRPAEGELTVRKTDGEGRTLAGAVFRLTAYLPPDFRNPVFTRMFSGSEGTVTLSGLPVGKVQEDGSVIPYSYRLQETVPPEGYRVNPEIQSFEFAPDRKGVSYCWGEAAVWRTAIKDEKTKVTIQKQMLGGAFVEGAHLAVCHVTGIGQDGEYLYDGENPDAQWITQADEPDHVITGLTAGQTYLLKECRAPEGFLLMEPIAFTLSEDGGRIASFRSRLAAVTVHGLNRVTLGGRYAVKTVMSVSDKQGNPVAEWVSSGQGHTLFRKDGIRDGETYVFTERTVYSDGSREMTARVTLPAHLKDGACRIADRKPERVHLRLEDGEGKQTAAWYPDEDTPELTLGDDASREEILRANSRYVLRETTLYSDGSRRERILLAFTVSEDGLLRGIAAYDQTRKVTVSKTDITGEKELPGARLQILDEAGRIVEEWVSDGTPHEAEAALEPGKTYLLRETAAPEGYACASDVSFTVEADGSVQQVFMEDRETRVWVDKTDITGENEVPGARLQIFDRDGNCVEEWISDGSTHEIEGKLAAGETYILHEETAPAGYAYAADVEFTVSADGKPDRVIMKDERLPDRPGRPGQPREQTEKEPGIALAVYRPCLPGPGGVPKGSFRGFLIPPTGDGRNLLLPLTVMILSLVLLPRLSRLSNLSRLSRLPRGSRESGHWCGLLLIFLILSLSFVLWLPFIEVRAETAVPSGDEITVTFDTIDGQPDESDIPPDTYVWEGKEYVLRSYQIMEVPGSEEEETVTEVRRYEEVEQAMEIPETAEISRTGIFSGGEEAAVLQAADIRYENWRWVPGFRFTVTVRGYDSGSFYLGDRLVEVKETQPFEGCENELLELIGVNPEYYLIESARWVSEPQADENGVVCREAEVSGQKYVADVEVTYTGKTGNRIRGTAYQAVYGLEREFPPEADRDGSGTGESADDVGEGTPLLPVPAQNPPEKTGGFLEWFYHLSRRTRIILGLGLLSVPLIALLLLYRYFSRRGRFRAFIHNRNRK